MLIRYFIYILRWIVLAVPGAWVLAKTLELTGFGLYPAMVLSQGLMGAVVFFIDRKIIGGTKEVSYCFCSEKGTTKTVVEKGNNAAVLKCDECGNVFGVSVQEGKYELENMLAAHRDKKDREG